MRQRFVFWGLALGSGLGLVACDGKSYYLPPNLGADMASGDAGSDAALAGDATLAGLFVSPGTLSPEFTPATTLYTLAVPPGSREPT